MLKANARSRPGRFGEITSKFEFQALMDVGADLKKTVYDGTLFFVLAGEKAPF